MTSIIAIVAIITNMLILTYLIFSISRIRNKLRVVALTNNPFWATFQTQIVDTLHHPHLASYEMDQLLEKLEKLTITDDERLDLEGRLREISLSHQDLKERERAELLLFTMPRVLRESVNKYNLGEIN